MSTGPPSTSSAPPNLNGTPSPQPPWDGDRMFNIYIIDYCYKRGYKLTAKTLLEEAGLPDDSHPPINARQGLLFEWWSVFWVLFSAKNSGSGNGNDDAVLYAQHQAQQAAHRQAQAIRASSPSAMNRPVNGIISGAGPLTNGAPVPLPQLGQSSLMNGPPSTPMAYSGPLPVNGMRPGPTSNGPVIGTPAQQGVQRPPMAPQRGPNGSQFHSPTMAHSPQNPGAGGLSQPTQPSGPLGSSQSLPRTSMLPPNGPQGLPNSGQIGGPQQPSQPSYQALAPTSHPNSPAQNPMTAPSPSLSARRLPGQQPNDIRQMAESNANHDLFRIDSNKLGELKAEVGLRDKDLPSLTFEDKQRLLNLARVRGLISATPKPGMGQPNATPGPSNLNSSLQQRPQPGGLPQPPQGQQRSVKRSSTSPGDDNESSQQNESSPPANKRLRPSPPGEHSQPPMAPMVSYTHHPQQGTPGGLNNGMRMMPNMVFSGPPMSSMNNNNHMNMSLGPNMGIPHGMNPSSMNAGMTQLQYRQTMHTLHKNAVPTAALNMLSGSGQSPGSGESPFGNDPSQQRPGAHPFGASLGVAGQNRPGPQQQGKPTGMPPPPSPAMNAAKNAPGQSKDGGPESSTNSSPRNNAAIAGQGQSQGPSPQNASGSQGSQNMGGGTAPPTPAPAPASITAPSPLAILNNGGGGSQPTNQGHSNDQMGGDQIFSADFMHSLGVDNPLFPPDGMGGLDFDRDFANMVDLNGLDGNEMWNFN